MGVRVPSFAPAIEREDRETNGRERGNPGGARAPSVDFGAGGTIAHLTSHGIEVSYCIVTDGDAGGFDPTIARSEIPSIRRREQRAAGAAVGVTDIHFLGYHDGELEVTQAVRRDISRVIRQVRPDVVICQSPEINYDRMTEAAIPSADDLAEQFQKFLDDQP